MMLGWGPRDRQPARPTCPTSAAAPKHVLNRLTTEHTDHLGVCEVIRECTVWLQVNAPSSVCTQLLVRTPTDSTQQGPEGSPVKLEEQHKHVQFDKRV